MEITHDELKSLIYGGIEQSAESVCAADFSLQFDLPYGRCSRAVRCLVKAGLVEYETKNENRWSLKNRFIAAEKTTQYRLP